MEAPNDAAAAEIAMSAGTVPRPNPSIIVTAAVNDPVPVDAAAAA